jgi:putative ABC transport system ATP-binding protein
MGEEIIMRVEVSNLCKKYGENIIIENLNYVFEEGSMTAITGVSGSGKTTLLNIIGLLDEPTSGNVIINQDLNIKPFSKKSRELLRNKVGYLFQNYALIDDRSVEYNLLIALKTRKTKETISKIERALEQVDLKGFKDKIISECSGGEQQRIAIARLLVRDDKLILADEPTGSLDEVNKLKVLELIKNLNEQGKTIIIVTHDSEVSDMTSNVLNISKLS